MVDETYVTTNWVGPDGAIFVVTLDFDFDDFTTMSVFTISGRGMEGKEIGIGAFAIIIGEVLMLVTLAPHLISTEYCRAAASKVSVIEDDLMIKTKVIRYTFYNVSNKK